MAKIDDEPTAAPAEEGAPLWTVTFGDMMSLLLTFFILLFSMSELKVDKFLLAAQSMREAIGGTSELTIEEAMGLMPDPVDPELLLQNPGLGLGSSEGGSDGVNESLAESYLQQIVDLVSEFVSENGLEDLVIVQKGADGVSVRIKASALFQSGSGTLDPAGRWIVEFMAELTSVVEVPVIVSGHADNAPISTALFASNWELSAVRAAGIAREVVALGHDPQLIRVESYGEFRPIASNDTPEGRAENRRVEFFYDRRDIVAYIEQWRATLVP